MDLATSKELESILVMHSCMVLIAYLMLVCGTQSVVYGDLYLHNRWIVVLQINICFILVLTISGTWYNNLDPRVQST